MSPALYCVKPDSCVPGLGVGPEAQAMELMLSSRLSSFKYWAIVFAGLIAVCLAEYSHTIYVDPVNGSNTTACLTDNNASQPCRNLSYAFQYRNHSTQYLLHPGTHYLNSIASDSPFTDLEEIAIRGMGSGPEDTEVVCSTANAGLAFINVTNVDFVNVTFSNCASLQNSTSKNFSSDDFELSSTQVGLYFSLCVNVSMDSVHVADSPQASGVTMYNTIGVNTFTDCSFSNNSNPSPVSYPGGGGVYIEFSYCLPGNTSCENGVEESYTDHNHGSTYNFTHCVFTSNNASNTDPKSGASFILPHRQNHDAFGRGGGLSLFFSANATGNNIFVTHCLFEHNQALWGGGMLASFRDTAIGNQLIIAHTTFEGNKVFLGSDTSGGGLRLGHYVFGRGITNSTSGNNVTLVGCQFYNNTASSGGGLSFSPSPQEAAREFLISVVLIDCVFENNTAKLGLAVHLLRFGLIVDGSIPPIHIANISITNNTIISTNRKQAYEEGGGAMYMNGVRVKFQGDVTFSYNSGSALLIVQSVADFQNCTVVFTRNRGLKGGALLLLGDSSFVVNQSTEMLFVGNVALWKGGAIYNQYVDRNNVAQVPHCFVRHQDPYLTPENWNASFFFINNSDHEGPTAIHSTSLLPCSWAGGSTIGTVDDVFCWRGWSYNLHRNESHCKHHISSSPGKIEFTPNISAFPGREKYLPINISDDLNQSMQIGFHAFSLNPEIAKVRKAFEYIAGNTLQFTGIGGMPFTLELDSTSQRTWHMEMTITIRDCPPGFASTQNGSESVCNCTGGYNDAFSGTLLCDNVAFNASLSGGHWMGKVNKSNDTVLVGDCPPKFCYEGVKRKYIPLPDDWGKLDSHICRAQNRTGILCGKCLSGHGPAVNPTSSGFYCVPCQNINVAAHVTYYILSVYVPLSLLFLAIIVFNIKLTSGPANAFILYSQVISSTFDLNADGQIPLDLSIDHSSHLLRAYQFPYGIFNLRFFEQFMKPLCFSDHLNTLDVLAFDYLVGLFPLVMILLVILYVKIKGCLKGHCGIPRWKPRSKLSKYLPRYGEYIIPAFASFLLLSYSKFSLTSSYIISERSLIDENGNSEESRVYYAGQYSSQNSLYKYKYFLPAIIILVVFCVIPPILLLEYPLKWFEKAISKVYCLRRHYPMTKVQIFLDAFQGCYRNRMRFFAGLYFIFRLIIDLSYTLSDNWIAHYVLQEVACIVFIILLAICRPYTQEYRIFNYVDILIFANLATINMLSLYLYTLPRINPQQSPSLALFVIQYILVFLPLLYMIIYLVWHFTAPYLLPIFINIRERHREGSREHSGLVDSRSFAGNLTWSIISSSDAHARRRNVDSGGIDWDRANLKNTYRPNPKVVQAVKNDRSHSKDKSEDSSLPVRLPPPPSGSSTANYASATYGSTESTGSPASTRDVSINNVSEREPLLEEKECASTNGSTSSDSSV